MKIFALEVISMSKETDKYFIFSSGKVFSKKNKRLLKTWITNAGYFQINIDYKVYLLHRLIAETFIPNPKNLPFVNHIDGIKTNNSFHNLEWCTAIGTSRAGRLKNSEIRSIRTTRKETGLSYSKLSDMFGISKSQISNIITHKQWQGV